MDINQLAQQVAWLDEQRRRDRNELLALQQRIEAQTAQMQELTRKLQETEGRLAGATAQLTRFTQVDQALNQLKEEVTLMLRREEEQRQIAEREAGRMRMVERETITKAINELRQQVRGIGKMQDDIELRKAEEKRLSEALIALQQELREFKHQSEAWPKSVTYLEEQRRLDNKRLTQLQQETAELLKRSEEYKGHFEIVEKSLTRLEGRLNSLWNMRDEMRSELARAQESLLLGEEERNRRAAAQAQQFDGFVAQMEDFSERIKQFTERFEQDQRTLAQLGQLEERLKRDQAQVAELQRLAEERMRKQYEEFLAEDERRWRKHEVSWNQQWSDQNRVNAGLVERFVPIDEQLRVLAGQIKELWDAEQAFARLFSTEAERWLTDLARRWEERTR